MDFADIFIRDTSWKFILEIIIRCVVMYLIIIIFLRLSGKRGIRQLSIFEVAIILCLGSAAGDPMFMEELPIIQTFTVVVTILLLYRITTWSMVKNKKIEALLEGLPLCVVEDGKLVFKDLEKETFSHDEFFAEMRQQNVEHLGQIRTALLESDGALSLLFFEKKDIKWGLPIFPKAYQKATLLKENTFYSCMKCGETRMLTKIDQSCPRCHHSDWAESLRTSRTSV
ncbi:MULTISPECIES: DUF421 domain-containing protein [Acinetobacter]|jgi:uncharacterized membrane protein YcaP (DUF421 family)|uniref:DUF421 domain-containing protein n=1 Tax=Acinetobacter radioresistens TaxID=40216 RepID=A0A8H2PSI4_ACIRA|nr:MULTISPECIES: YetF domain-containing protein [Acinetobacter]ENV88958.1 hypothetical protein F939_01681 [Acinetobacter radioresistens DSM 6976 = NBRC 102413 = CIP 103788]EXB35048.1 hypothetical protein J546_0469 [Acinetobacter sp. 1461402]EXB74264.1 hypothetical protein J550_0529 [Acinetobacter sp. 230853]EXE15265.1 hypothetical protein J559_0836 [Acinetobacter sp. 983759]KCX38850.1 hypothetical protein J577_0759 [Acinetobacter sp. 263903-1]